MAATLTVDAFLDVIRRSRLVRPEDLEQILKESEGDGPDLSTPKAIAEALVERDLLTRWQTDYLLQGKHKGFFLGPYRFLRLLGKGGMGAVYLAQHEMMRRRCAIKVLPAKLLKDKSSVLERFYLEAQAVASLDHPNIVRAYDVNKETQAGSDIHYLVMEYVEGKDLQTVVHERAAGLDYVEVAEFARQAACGLAHAHESGLIHRDIKPANLLVDGKGIVKILDLGLARFFDDRLEASLTTAYNESILGTADYLSPEQALNSHQVDTRTDIYSLGCTCYFMLTGQPPFPDGSVAQRLIAHQVKAPAPIERSRPDVPRDLVAIVQKMIAKKPEDRYQSANEVCDTFRAWLLTHADANWKQQHRDVVGEGSGVIRSVAHEPTRARSSASEDTELELAPLEDASPIVRSATSDATVKTQGGSSPDSKAGRKTPSSVIAGGSPAAPRPQPVPPPEDLLSQPFDDILSQPLGEAFGVDPLAAQPGQPLGTLPTTSSSGIQRRAAATSTPVGENTRLIWLLLIGLGIGIPLALVILFISTYWNAAPTSDLSLPNTPNPVSADLASVPAPAVATQEVPTSQSEPPKRKWNKQPGSMTVPPPTTEQPYSAPGPPFAAGDRPTGTVPGTAGTFDQSSPMPSQPPSQPPSPESAAANVPFSNPQAQSQQTQPPQTRGGPTSPDSSAPSLPQPSDNAASGPAAAPAKKDAQASAEPSAEERQRLFATLGDVPVSVAMSRESRTKIAAMVLRAAYEAWKEEGVPVKMGARNEDKAVLIATLNFEKNEPMVVLKVSAELRYQLEGGKSAVLWQGERPVGTISAQFLNRDVVPPAVRGNVTDFFGEMIMAYREARSANP